MLLHGATGGAEASYAAYIHRLVYSSGARDPVPAGGAAPRGRRTPGRARSGNDGADADPARGARVIVVPCRHRPGGSRSAGSGSGARRAARLTSRGAVPWTQSLQFSALWFAGYAPAFATTLLLSIGVTSQLTALTAAWVLFVAHTVLASAPRLRVYRLNVQWMTSGFRMPYLDPHSSLIVEPLPWLRLLVAAALTVALLLAAVWMTARQDF